MQIIRHSRSIGFMSKSNFIEVCCNCSSENVPGELRSDGLPMDLLELEICTVCRHSSGAIRLNWFYKIASVSDITEAQMTATIARLLWSGNFTRIVADMKAKEYFFMTTKEENTEISTVVKHSTTESLVDGAANLSPDTIKLTYGRKPRKTVHHVEDLIERYA